MLGYGVGFGVLQFLFLYLAMAVGMPTGLASLVLQSSAPFTVLLAGVLLRERISGRQALGTAVAIAGLSGIAVHRADVDGGALLLPVLLTLCGGLGWALGNLATRQARAPHPLRLTMWMSVVPPLPMLAVSLLVEGPAQIGRSFTGLGTTTGLLAVGGLAYTVLVGTVLGSGLWATLMSRNPSSSVAPFSMLVPVVGIGAAWTLLGEPTRAPSWPGAPSWSAGCWWGRCARGQRGRRTDGSRAASERARKPPMTAARTQTRTTSPAPTRSTPSACRRNRQPAATSRARPRPSTTTNQAG